MSVHGYPRRAGEPRNRPEQRPVHAVAGPAPHVDLLGRRQQERLARGVVGGADVEVQPGPGDRVTERLAVGRQEVLLVGRKATTGFERGSR